MIGYHASHEQFSPRNLLELMPLVSKAGFSGVMSSDHIAPWSVRQGQSGFAWSWLGSAMQIAPDLSFGSLAIPGGWRYHPAIVAQAAATLAQMYPGRFGWIAVGSGEAMNEHIIGEKWPDKSERNARLYEAVSIIRDLWAGNEVTRLNSLIKTDRTRLWSLPEKAPRILGAALSVETAGWMGEWTDGLITTRQPLEDLTNIVQAFRDNGGEEKDLVLQMQVSWAHTIEDARLQAFDQWRSNLLTPEQHSDLYTPEDFDRATKDFRPEDMDDKILLATNSDVFIEEISAYKKLGFKKIYLHNVGHNQREFIDFIGREVIPKVE